MPLTRLFNPHGRELYPPRPVNPQASDVDIPRLRIIIVPAKHYLPAEALPNVAPIVAGGSTPIPADDAQPVRLADGTVATPLNDTLRIPTFFGPDAFPEPTVSELDAENDVHVVRSVADTLTDDAPVATGTPHVMTAAEQQALERELQQLEEQRGERLRGVKVIPPQDIKRPLPEADEPISLTHPPVLTGKGPDQL